MTGRLASPRCCLLEYLCSGWRDVDGGSLSDDGGVASFSRCLSREGTASFHWDCFVTLPVAAISGAGGAAAA